MRTLASSFGWEFLQAASRCGEKGSGVRFPAGMNNKIRAADAKEVGVGNPAEETYCYPNAALSQFCNSLSIFCRVLAGVFHLTYLQASGSA